MRGHRHGAPSAPSFFPFLSVLVCVLGVLMFLGAVIASTSLSRATANVQITVEGTLGQGRKPIMLECTGDAARTLDGEVTFSGSREEPALKADQFSGTPFTDFLEQLSQSTDREYLLFVVRPDGIRTFEILRDLLVVRNQKRFQNAASVSKSIDKAALGRLSEDLQRRIRYDDGELIVRGALSAAQRDELKGLFADPSSQQAIDELFARAQNAAGWVDHGVELVPAEWRFQQQTPPGAQP